MNPLPENAAEDDSHDARLLSRRRLSDTAFEVHLTSPSAFDFNPGQRIRFTYQEEERDYSLISSPDQPGIALCIRRVDGGFFSPLITGAEPGTRFSFTGPHGYFIFRPSERPAVFVATGTGIAPFVSMARCGVKGFILFHGVRSPAECFYASLFEDVAGTYVSCISGPVKDRPSTKRGFIRGRVTDGLLTQLPLKPYDFYLCGRGEMIRDATLLIDERFPGARVYSETFF